MRTLWIRADASPLIGLGHVMRTLSVADEAEARGLEVRYLCRPEPLVERVLSRRGIPWEPVSERDWSDRLEPSDLLVVDTRRSDPELLERATVRGVAVGVVDDTGKGVFPVDVVLNQNVERDVDYATRDDTTLLLGPRHALLRREILSRPRGRSGESRTLLLTFGGADVAGLAGTAIEVLSGLPRSFATVILLLGPSSTVRGHWPNWVTVVHDPTGVGEVFDRADAAISAAGSTTWELLYLGIPSALVQVAPDQRVVLETVAAREAAEILGDVSVFPDRVGDALIALSDPRRRRSLGRRALELVDGGGAARFLDALERKPVP